MRLPILFALALAAAPSALAAADWKEVDRLTGDVPVELDQDSVGKAMDGTVEVVQATFRRQMPTGIMESDVAVDCEHGTARLRAIRTITGKEVYKQPGSTTLEYQPVGFGSADAIYYKALCGKEIALPEGYLTDEPPAPEDASGAPLDLTPVEETGGQ